MDCLLKATDRLLSALARRNIFRTPLFRWRLALLRYAELAIPSATTKADHHALPAYYYEEARLFQVDATWHERIAKVYGSGTYPKARDEAMQRHDAMARKFREMAEEHLALARIHHQLADEALQGDPCVHGRRRALLPCSGRTRPQYRGEAHHADHLVWLSAYAGRAVLAHLPIRLAEDLKALEHTGASCMSVMCIKQTGQPQVTPASDGRMTRYPSRSSGAVGGSS
jgi:hypothetical protein